MKKVRQSIRRRGRRSNKPASTQLARVPKNPYGGKVYFHKIEAPVDVFVYMTGGVGYYSFVINGYNNIAQILNTFIHTYAKDISNLFNGFAFWSLNAISLNFDRSINMNDSRIIALPPLYIDVLGSMTTAQANMITTRTIAESDTALKVNMQSDDPRDKSKYFEFSGNFNTITGTQAFGKHNYMTTDYFPILNGCLGQMDQPLTTESIKIGQLRTTFYCSFTKRININNFT